MSAVAHMAPCASCGGAGIHGDHLGAVSCGLCGGSGRIRIECSASDELRRVLNELELMMRGDTSVSRHDIVVRLRAKVGHLAPPETTPAPDQDHPSAPLPWTWLAGWENEAYARCQCTNEQGDRDCAVHPGCPHCGEQLVDARGTPLIVGLVSRASAQYMSALVGSIRRSARIAAFRELQHHMGLPGIPLDVLQKITEGIIAYEEHAARQTLPPKGTLMAPPRKEA